MTNKFIVSVLFLLSVNLCLSSVVIAGVNSQSNSEKLYYNSKTTEHSININGTKLKYNATPGRISLFEKVESKEINITNMSYIAYSLNNDKSTANRPITFLFNGGPGACSSDINFLGTGPKICKINVPKEFTLEQKQKLIDNPDTWLQFTDLVYIDAPGTGFSTVPNESCYKYAYGCEADANCFAEFIYLFLKKYNRFESPYFIAGESYGGIRVPLTASNLTENYSLPPLGLIMLSPVLNYGLDANLENSGTVFSYLTAIPSMTIAAYTHNKLDEELQNKPLKDLITEVEKWVMNDYLLSITRLNSLIKQERDNLEKTLVKYTGLSNYIVSQYNYKIPLNVFIENLLHDKNAYLSQYDSRCYQKHPGSYEYSGGADPYFTNTSWASNGTIFQSFITDLEIDTNIRYEVVNMTVADNWSYQNPNQAVYALEVISTVYNLLTSNPSMKAVVGSGYYDLCIPYFGQKFNIEQTCIPDILKNNLIQQHYFSGHEIYSDCKARQELFLNMKEFYAAMLKQNY